MSRAPAVPGAGPTGRRPGRPRTVVTTDPELDDLNSMLRLLLYSNEIDLRGLVYSSSQFHVAGDPERGIAPHRWPAPGERLHIDQAVDAYEQVHPTLLVHDPAYPSPEHLRDLIAWGNVAGVGDMQEDTPGSDLIRAVLLEDAPGPVFLQTWGGPNTIARALRSIQLEFEGTPGWETLHARISRTAVITSFGQQDSTFDDYIRPHWPDIEHREVATQVWGYFARDVVAEEDLELLEAPWMRENVSRVGAIGRAYRVWGDGLQMADGFDDEDYFGLSGLSADELADRGYRVWAPVQPEGAWISEGDSSNFALLIDNGLRSWEHPGWGGWGGRQGPVEHDPASWSNHTTTDHGPEGTPRPDWSAARWFRPIQHDLAARLQWTVQPTFAAANHPPRVRVREGTDLSCPAGATLALTAEVSDPDGDEVRVRWWQYREAGTSPLAVAVRSDGERCEIDVPAEAEPGTTVHVIAEATDSGAPALTRYQRVVIEVAEASAG